MSPRQVTLVIQSLYLPYDWIRCCTYFPRRAGVLISDDEPVAAIEFGTIQGGIGLAQESFQILLTGLFVHGDGPDTNGYGEMLQVYREQMSGDTLPYLLP